MKPLFLFCDGSVHPQTKVGFGAYFTLETLLESSLKSSPTIHLKKFTQTSSTKLELEVLLWALSTINAKEYDVHVYTDCQNILSLQTRRKKLEQMQFNSSSGQPLKNHELYKAFYQCIDQLQCEFVKVQGHKASNQKNSIDKLFNRVDKASRKALREYLKANV